MTISYTDEMKLPQHEDGGYNWGAIVNGIVELLDKGNELTFTFGEDVSAGDAVALSSADGKIYKALATSDTLTPAIGFAPNDVSSGNEGKVRYFGWIDVDTSFSVGASVSWSAGQLVYPGAVAGRISKTAQSFSNELGWAKADTDSSWTTRIRIQPHIDFWSSALYSWLTQTVFSSDGGFNPNATPEFAGITVLGSVDIIIAERTILLSTDDSNFLIGGGDATNSGANMAFFGGSHSSLPNVIRFRQGSTTVFYLKDGGNLGLGGNTDPQENLHAADTIRADVAFNLNGSDGLSGTLEIDDGVNWNVQLTFSGGILTAQTIGASTGATATWT